MNERAVEPVEAHGWRVRSSRVAYENPWLRVREDLVVRPDGSDGLYGVVELTRPAVFVVALTDAGEVLLVDQYRYPTRARGLEIPSGGADEADLLVAARRELREETGYEAARWTQLGSLDPMNGVVDARHHVFLAEGLTPGPDADQTAREQRYEGIYGVRTIPWAQVLDLVRSGQITDNDTLAALLLTAVHRGTVAPPTAG